MIGPVKALADRLAWLVATAFGAGRSPLAPGTAGSAVGVLLFWPLASLSPAAQAAAILGLAVLGTVAGGRLASRLSSKDPGLVVVDEVAGQWLTLAALPFTPATAALGFLLFRAMDVLKPWPARDLERLPGGLGIMADDLAAGVYAHLLLRVVLLLWPAAGAA